MEVDQRKELDHVEIGTNDVDIHDSVASETVQYPQDWRSLHTIPQSVRAVDGPRIRSISSRQDSKESWKTILVKYEPAMDDSIPYRPTEVKRNVPNRPKKVRRKSFDSSVYDHLKMWLLIIVLITCIIIFMQIIIVWKLYSPVHSTS
ncbi:hypothetical protein HNY73_011088 [Argiope bruennichi]|uniref:Uncharacterized protein n=1 Tax=Argiope bruennichi TaxID=94029 RepID=A0A8T0F832_ARGBR|nr:hypothetical protein HNY73_011088 [Argiope bruennichi]